MFTLTNIHILVEQAEFELLIKITTKDVHRRSQPIFMTNHQNTKITTSEIKRYVIRTPLSGQ